MPQRQQPIDETEPHIETPVIDMQDLEHNPTPLTRVTNRGVKVEPRMDATDLPDFGQQDEAAIEALEKLEQQLKEPQDSYSIPPDVGNPFGH